MKTGLVPWACFYRATWSYKAPADAHPVASFLPYTALQCHHSLPHSQWHWAVWPLFSLQLLFPLLMTSLKIENSSERTIILWKSCMSLNSLWEGPQIRPVRVSSPSLHVLASRKFSQSFMDTRLTRRQKSHKQQPPALEDSFGPLVERNFFFQGPVDSQKDHPVSPPGQGSTTALHANFP